MRPEPLPLPDIGAAPTVLPRHLSPMQPRVAEAAFNSPDYLFEVKWDGVRAFAGRDARSFWIVDRKGDDLLARLPELESIGRQIPEGTLLDGEVVACDARGRPRYELLAGRLGPRAARRGYGPLLLAFDLLYESYRALFARPLIERRERLARLVPAAGGRLVVPEHLESDGEPFLEAVRELELEGVVAKRRASAYVPGARAADWLKVHARPRTDVVLCGAVLEHGLPRTLLCGAHREGRLVSVGTAYVPPYLRAYLAEHLPPEQDVSPFEGPVDVPSEARWLRPALCAILEHGSSFTGALPGDARFRTLRVDAQPADCRIDEPLRVPSQPPTLSRERPRLVVLRSLFSPGSESEKPGSRSSIARHR